MVSECLPQCKTSVSGSNLSSRVWLLASRRDHGSSRMFLPTTSFPLKAGTAGFSSVHATAFFPAHAVDLVCMCVVLFV